MRVHISLFIVILIYFNIMIDTFEFVYKFSRILLSKCYANFIKKLQKSRCRENDRNRIKCWRKICYYSVFANDLRSHIRTKLPENTEALWWWVCLNVIWFGYFNMLRSKDFTLGNLDKWIKWNNAIVFSIISSMSRVFSHSLSLSLGLSQLH